ncbi:CYTH domain-containing protein [Paraburkholderia sp. JHI869]|uniref:CYTH domain-containing protein n=1 Tax=Paraburkholderia sp. JHI869 TaxID=3112959 RepID=UPI00316D1C44
MERELKLRIASGYLAKLRRAPLLAHGKPRASPARLLTSTYFDTPELAFHQCGASLRIRGVGQERIQTLKLDSPAQAGMFDRDEFEMPVDRDTPDLTLLRDALPADTDCGRLVRDDVVAARLAPSSPGSTGQLSRCARRQKTELKWRSMTVPLTRLRDPCALPQSNWSLSRASHRRSMPWRSNSCARRRFASTAAARRMLATDYLSPSTTSA